MTSTEGAPIEVSPPSPTEYNSYVLGSEYAAGYIANFRETTQPDIDLHDPELAARLDMPLSELLEREGVAQGLPASALQTDLSVRDVLVLGSIEGVSELPYLDDRQEAAIVDVVQARMPEFALIRGLAPTEVACWFYEDPLDIPLSARLGRKVTVRDVLGTDQESHYSRRVAALTSAEPIIETPAPAAGAAVQDSLTAAIEDVTHTMGEGK